MSPSKFSASDLTARLQGLSRDARIATIRQYLDALRVNRRSHGQRFDFFEAEGFDGEVIFYGPASRPGMGVGLGMKNVLVIDARGRVHFILLDGLIPMDIKRPVPLAKVDYQLGQSELIAE